MPCFLNIEATQRFWSYLHLPSTDETETSSPASSPKKDMSNTAKQEVSQLKEFAEKFTTNKIQPVYETVDRMVQNKKEFTVKCRFQGNQTTGTATSIKEAKRISAMHMLAVLYEKDSSKFNTPPRKDSSKSTTPSKKVEEELDELKDFDKSKLNMFLDQYLDNREKDNIKFRKLFIGDIPEIGETPFQENDEVAYDKPVKSSTLEKLKITGMNAVNFDNACRFFKDIVQEMKLTYYVEFVETAKNDKYAVIIKLNLNFFTTGGIGNTPEKAIQATCKNAIQLLYIFN